MLLDGWSVDERVGASPDHYAHHRTVKDTTGAALPGVTLVVVNQDSGLPARSWPNACFRRRQKNRKRWGRRRRRAKCVYLGRSLGPNIAHTHHRLMRAAHSDAGRANIVITSNERDPDDPSTICFLYSSRRRLGYGAGPGRDPEGRGGARTRGCARRSS